MNMGIIYFNLVIPSVLMVVPFVLKMLIPGSPYGTIAIVVYTIILPAILTIFNLAIFISKIEPSFLKCSLFMLIGILLGNLTGYIIWGISSKNLFKPDGETIWIAKSLIIYHVCFVVILYTVVMGGKFLIQFFKKN